MKQETDINSTARWVLAVGLGLATMSAQAATISAGVALEVGQADTDATGVLADLAANTSSSATDYSIYIGYQNEWDDQGNYAHGNAGVNQDGWMYSNAGGENTFKAVSHVQQALTITNDTGVDQNYSFDFTILFGSLSAYGAYEAFDAGEFVAAGNLVTISLDGVDLFSSSAYLRNDENGVQLVTDGAVLGSYTPGSEYYYWDAFSDSLDLGVFAAGESFTLTYDIYTAAAGIYAGSGGGYGVDGECAEWDVEFEGCYYDGTYAYSQFGDPNGVNGSPIAGNVHGSPVSVSEPGVWLLMGTGLFGFAVARRRKSANG